MFDFIGVASKKPPNLGQRRFQRIDLLCQRRLDRRVVLRGVGFAMALDQVLHRTLHLLDLLAEVGPRPAPRLGRVRRELHPVHREHLPSDEPHLVADQEHVPEHRDDLAVEPGDEGGNRGEVGLAVGTQGDEDHVLAAQPRDLAARGNPACVAGS